MTTATTTTTVSKTLFPAKPEAKPACARSGSPRVKRITDMPSDILYLILIHVYRDDDAAARAFAQTCSAFQALYRTVSSGGQYALPLTLSPPTRNRLNTNMSDLLVTPVGPRGADLCIEKRSAYGDSYVVFDRDVRHTSSSWRLRLDTFKGHRLDVGVALSSAFRHGMVERASSWRFDLFGRACAAGESISFGRQFLPGDVLTIVYDAGASRLAFIDGSCGACMGSLYVDVGSKTHLALHPFIYFPALAGERITLLAGAAQVIDLHRIHASTVRWKREPASLPYDGCIIVATWEEHRWYALRFDDLDATPVSVLWSQVAQRHGMSESLFELIFNGARLPNTHNKTLRDVGIHIDCDTGSCTADILLSVPHIVS